MIPVKDYGTKIANAEGSTAAGTKGQWVTNPKTGIEQFFPEGTEIKFDTGTSLPDLPPSGTTPPPAGLSTSLPAVNKEDIEAKTRASLAGTRSILEKTYAQRISEAQGLSEQEKTALEGQLGAKRRFSSSAQAFIKFTDDENKKKIANLELQRDEALSNFDFKMVELINSRIKDEQANAQQQFENILKLTEAAQKQTEAAAKTTEQNNQLLIEDVMSKGITDPMQIFNSLRTKNVPLSQISKVLKEMNDAEVQQPGIVGEWLAAKKSDPQFKDSTLEDYWNFKNPTAALEFKEKQLNILKLQQELNNMGSNADPAVVESYVDTYASTGKLTGVPKNLIGIVSQQAKEMPKTKGLIIDRNTGVKSSTIESAMETGFASLYSAIELAKQLKELDKLRWHGVIAGTTGKVFGSQNQQRYVDLKTQISDLLGRARSGAALSPAEEKRYSDMLPGRAAEPFGFGAEPDWRIDNFINTLTSDFENKMATQGVAAYGFSKVKVGDKEYTIGDVIQNANGQSGRVNSDGTITLIQ